ncbi:hypothetical protein chiPu_0006808 [Chiloscyllium punctatum]|uniref:Uncharacterized protein n=1 Tax=Chiloscyllium punctatum TaxID=137246 RepID=A0A401SDB0_CHIPU|nr:hypothetical protein [Chiloscyllium punctatum]
MQFFNQWGDRYLAHFMVPAPEGGSEDVVEENQSTFPLLHMLKCWLVSQGQRRWFEPHIWLRRDTTSTGTTHPAYDKPNRDRHENF